MTILRLLGVLLMLQTLHNPAVRRSNRERQIMGNVMTIYMEDLWQDVTMLPAKLSAMNRSVECIDPNQMRINC